MFEFVGIITKVGAVIPTTGKIKEKCTFVVKEERGEREIAFLLFDEKIYEILQPLEVGDRISVTFSLKSKEYQGSYTTNCYALSVTLLYRNSKQSSSDSFGGNKYRTGGFEKEKKAYDNWHEEYRKKSEKEKTEEDERQNRFWEDFQNRFKQSTPPPPPPPSGKEDYFKGIKDSDKDQAKKLYNKLSKSFHPDSPSGGSIEKMQKLNEDYDRFRDKKQYERKSRW